MARAVSLKAVTADNWEAVVDLELTPEQTDMVANNCYSLAESKFDPDARPRAIYAGKRIVGFLMYEVVADERPSLTASIYRFMIDRRHQGKGYGRAALAEVLKEIQSISGVQKVSICYLASNHQAKQFYANFGFREVGHDRDGETIAELNISACDTVKRNL